jgi:uncharacterized delta-60 repeat protein
MTFPALLRGAFLSGLAFVASLAWATPGELDLTFGGTGKVATGISLDPVKLIILPDGKMLTIGIGDGILVARWNIDGTPDTSFHGTGLVTTNPQDQFNLADAELQADGKVVVVGRSYPSNGNPALTVLRLNPDGGYDSTFAGTGSRALTNIAFTSFASQVAIQPDGKIVVGGGAQLDNGVITMVAARFNANGTLDTHFNTRGYRFIPIGDYAECNALALQPDGRIILGGRGRYEAEGFSPLGFSVVRLLKNGKLDTSFHGTGKVQGPGSGGVLGSTIQKDGKIIVTGFGDQPPPPDHYGPLFVLRFTTSGVFDSTFGDNGGTYFITERVSYSTPVFQQEDGKIVVAGDKTLARFLPGGQLDSAFDQDGRQTSLSVDVRRIGLLDGKIIVAGIDADHHLAFERYLGDDPPLVVSTLPATNVIAHDAVLRGEVNPAGEENISAYFEWGLSPTAMTNTTPPVAVGNGSAAVPLQAAITGLERTTLYYYRVRTTPFVTNIGEVRNFITVSDLPPGIVSKPASSLAMDGATLNAAVNPNNQATAAYFEWGTSTSYGNQTATMDVTVSTSPVAINAALTGLTTDQTYHFRAVATNQAGTTLGPDRTFVPSAGAPQPQDDVVLIDGVTTIEPLDNDIDPNGDPLSLVSLDPDALPDPASGSAQVLGNLIFYTPTDGMLQDEFGYIVQDATGKTARARVRAYRLSEIRGEYFGVLSQTEGTGKLNLELSPSGAFSLLLTWLGQDYALKGRLGSAGSFQTGLRRKSADAGGLLLLQLQYNPLSGQVEVQLTDSVIGGPFAFAAPLGGEADEAVDAVRNTLYTTTIDVPDSGSALPEGAAAASGFAAYRGSGFASVKIAKNRSARFVGQMPDTAKFSAGSPVSRRTYAFYSALYRVKRGALGSVSGQTTLQSDFELRSDSLTWQRQADNRDTIFNGAFTTPAFLNGDRYTPPTRGQLLQIGLELTAGTFSNANLNMTLGGLAPEFSQKVKFIPGSVRVVGENPSAVKLRISPTTGTFSGSFTHDVSQAATKFSGIFITSPFQIREGRGGFRGVGAGGKVRIAKP